jgi:hypothetical protein
MKEIEYFPLPERLDGGSQNDTGEMIEDQSSDTGSFVTY